MRPFTNRADADAQVDKFRDDHGRNVEKLNECLRQFTFLQSDTLVESIIRDAIEDCERVYNCMKEFSVHRETRVGNDGWTFVTCTKKFLSYEPHGLRRRMFYVQISFSQFIEYNLTIQ